LCATINQTFILFSCFNQSFRRKSTQTIHGRFRCYRVKCILARNY